MFIQACGVLLKEENACVLLMSSVEEEEWLGQKIKRDPKHVTTDIHKAFIYTKSLSPDKCLLKMVINADPHLDYIP